MKYTVPFELYKSSVCHRVKDYLSRENGLPLCAEYRDIRARRLDRTVYPDSILAYAIATGDESIKSKSYRESIPEFRRFNIVENEVRDVL